MHSKSLFELTGLVAILPHVEGGEGVMEEDIVVAETMIMVEGILGIMMVEIMVVVDVIVVGVEVLIVVAVDVIVVEVVVIAVVAVAVIAVVAVAVIAVVAVVVEIDEYYHLRRDKTFTKVLIFNFQKFEN
ncbi:unnamed protein product [Meloidogyne enterolobii]|uniref:Uncharacterized protein n=1 Tax=Meloidogyne enterolobii TaxID=390850 RepID=A0ACB1AL19_MELEN